MQTYHDAAFTIYLYAFLNKTMQCHFTIMNVLYMAHPV